MNLRILLLTLTVTIASGLGTLSDEKRVGIEPGNWTFGDCLMVQFAMNFSVHPDPKNKTTTMQLLVPTTATVNPKKSSCGETVQSIELEWQEPMWNETSVMLNRTLGIRFAPKPNDTFYGVSRLYAVFTLARWTMNETEYMSEISLDSGDMSNLMFHTPLDKSFLCANIGDLALKTTLKYNDSAPDGTKLTNSTISALQVHFDAFRIKERSPPTGFRTSIDCDYRPNDIVPIAVGVALALLIVVVLVAYLVGRKRHRQRGYQSV